ncbi:MAG: hypothetical protein V3S89_07740 [Desulfobacterales bacterium]
MAEINYKALEKHLLDLEKNGGGKPLSPVYLIYGEELLYKTALGTLLEKLLPPTQRSLNYEPVEGINENIHIALERVNTFSLLSGTKVVALLNSQVFYSKQMNTALIENAKDAYDSKDLKKAAGYFLSALQTLDLTLEDMKHERTRKTLLDHPDMDIEDTWIDQITAYCTDQQLVIPTGQDGIQILEDAIVKGFPKNNHLIITAEMVDKRKRLFKKISEKGTIIDCSVPRGERRADKTAQEAVLSERMGTILSSSGKTMGRDAYSALSEMTGFDLRTFSNNLEKLINYVGDRKSITVADVESALERTKKDPIFELTNAVTDKNTKDALFFLSSLLSEDIHPLQAMAAIINAMRRLLAIKGFLESPAGNTWQPNCQYNQFQRTVMPAIQAHDKALLDQLEKWQYLGTTRPEADSGEATPRGKKKKKLTTDLLVAKNPNNAYPVYQNFKKSDKFTKEQLIATIGNLASADRRLKSTQQNPKLVVEETIIRICMGQ